MIDLNDRDAILKTQGGDTVLKSVDAFPLQVTASWAESQRVEFPDDYKKVSSILVCGMGGSRFPALILRELFKEEITVPYLINDDYHLPGFVDKNTLVILSSYSGTTEEVIINGKASLKKGAKLAGIAAGGEVESFLKEHNYPVYVFDPVYNPSKQPRIGFGYNVGGHLGIMMKLGLIKADKKKVADALKNFSRLLEKFQIGIPTDRNPAKQLAEMLYDRYPYYIVAEFLTGVGNAFQNQTNETAKLISSFRVIPELNHHLMEGLKSPEAHRNLALFIFFFSKYYSPSIQKRFHITKEVVEQNKINTYWYELKGANKIEQAFEMMGLGTYVTMYLAALYEQDPSIIPFVDYFKNKLKEMR